MRVVNGVHGSFCMSVWLLVVGCLRLDNQQPTTQTSHLKNGILHQYNLLPGTISTANNACLLALYVNAPDALAHFIPLFFTIALGNTTKILRHALWAAQNDASGACHLIHE